MLFINQLTLRAPRSKAVCDRRVLQVIPQGHISSPYGETLREHKGFFFVYFVSVESHKLVPLYFNKSLKKSYHPVQGKVRFLAKPGETKAKPVGMLG